MVAVESLSAPFIAGGQEKVLYSLPSVQEPVPPSGQKLRLVSVDWAINGADGASTATVRDLHGYRTGPPGLHVQGLQRYSGLTFGEVK